MTYALGSTIIILKLKIIDLGCPDIFLLGLIK